MSSSSGDYTTRNRIDKSILKNGKDIMKKILFFVLIFNSLFFAKPNTILADVGVVSNSANIKNDIEEKSDEIDFRVIQLRNYLQSHNSPLTEKAEVFVENADKYNLDWRFVASITGVESTFGKRMIPNTYNAYGWGGGTIYFESWEDSIEHVSKSLREKYYDKGTPNIASVARRYAPPSSTWAWKVKFFMNKIDPIPVEFTI